MQTAAAPHPPLRVYIAEDSAEIRRRVAGLLQARRMKVVGEGVTPDACIEGILAHRPDAVVLDVQLEGGSGLQVLRAVREQRPGIQFIVFSNAAAPAYRKRYLREGAGRFLDKSTDFGALAEAIESACGREIH